MATEVSIVPNLTKERAEAFEKALDQKRHLEYLCAMALRRLNEMGLRSMMENAVKRGLIDQDDFEEFYGEGEDAGICEAEGHTVDALVSGWTEATNNMLEAIAGR